MSFRLFAILFALFFLYQTSWAQTQLTVRENKLLRGERVVTVQHVPEEGTATPDTADFRRSESIFFAFRPSEDWSIEEEETQVREVTLVQNGRELTPKDVTFITDSDSGFSRVTFAKSDIQITDPFVFANEIDTTTQIRIDEQYFPGYTTYRRAYEIGKAAFNKNGYLQGYDALKVFAAQDPIIEALSFGTRARQLLDQTVRGILKAEADTLQVLQESLAQPTVPKVKRAESFTADLEALQDTLRFYLSKQGPSYAEARQLMEDLLMGARNAGEDGWNSYRRTVLGAFFRGNYKDYRFSFFMEVMTRMLLEQETQLAPGTTLDTLKVEDLESPRFRTERREMQQLGWLNGFREIIQLINENIHERQYVIGEDNMDNFRLRQSTETQPHFGIYSGFNSLLEEDVETFRTKLSEAMVETSDPDMLHDLELWVISAETAPEDVSDRALELMMEGRNLQAIGDTSGAKNSFTLASRLASTYAPVYFFLGKLSYQTGRPFAAQSYFEKALRFYPGYLSPRIYTAQILINEEEYGPAVSLLDDTLAERTAWYLHFLRARSLYHLGRYNEARSVLVERCMALNDKSFDLHILLGDVALAMRDRAQALESYRRAGQLRPESDVFSGRMKKLRAGSN